MPKKKGGGGGGEPANERPKLALHPDLCNGVFSQFVRSFFFFFLRKEQKPGLVSPTFSGFVKLAKVT